MGINQLEHELVSRLIDYSHAQVTLFSFGRCVLDLLNEHPVLHDKTIALWQYNSNRVSIISSRGLHYDPSLSIATELSLLNQIKPLDVCYFSSLDNKGNHSYRIDIYLEKTLNNLYGISIWFDLPENKFFTKHPFFKTFLGVVNLGLLRINGKQQETLLNTILEKAGDSVEITDSQAIIHYVNPAFEKITQYKASEAMGQMVSTLLRSPQEDLALFKEIKHRLERGKTWRGQINSRKKDGSYWVAQTVIVPVMNDQGKVTQHIAIKQDITEQVAQINKLRISEARYRNLMNAASDGIFIHDLEGLILEVNTAGYKSLGYTREELENAHVWDIEVGASIEALNEMWRNLQHGPVNLEGKHRRKDGTIFPVDVRLGIFNATGKKLVLAIVRDISAQKESRDTIRKLTRALEQSPVLVMITDMMGNIEYVNAMTLEQTGYSSTEIIGKNIRILQSGQTPRETYSLMWQQISKGLEWRGELLNKNKQGEFFWVSMIISPLRNEDDGVTHYLAVMEDISQKKSYEEMLKHQATYDNLTNLPNRSYGYSRLEHAISRAQINKKKLAVLFLDLDEFKHVNDSLGHAAGDVLLKALSERYLSIIRKIDTISRLGGDEFMIILENLNQDKDAEYIAKKFQDICEEPFRIESQDIYVSSSIGIAIFPIHGTDAKTLMRNADTAMYQSKLRGKNNWTVFKNIMAEIASNHIRVKSELHQVLNKNELEIYYQPIISLKSNIIVAAEALLRWKSAKLGPVLPNQIIPIAEETGLIIPLGYWILEKVCQQAKDWQLLMNKEIQIAVNISTLQLKQKDFVSKVKEILEKNKLSPESLIFEITESAFIDDSKFILSQIQQLNEMNINCSLDDFGIGYSSLNYIRSYPFKSLKIDRAFIQGITTNSNDLNLVQSIVAMSRTLKLSVIAEGVETLEQLELVRAMNCDMVQGWYFSEALSNDNFLLYFNK